MTKNINLAVDDDVLAAIDLRLADLALSHGVKLSRTQWLNKCARWALHELPYGADKRTKIAAAQGAPEDVAGTEQYDMGLGTVEQQGSVK